MYLGVGWAADRLIARAQAARSIAGKVFSPIKPAVVIPILVHKHMPSSALQRNPESIESGESHCRGATASLYLGSG